MPMLSSPGDAISVSGVSLLRTRTIGRLGDVSLRSSSGVGSAYLRRASMSLAMTAKGLYLRPYHSLISPMTSRLQQMCIPPHPLTTARLPSSSMHARFAMGSPFTTVPSCSSSLYDGPQTGQQIVWWWNRLSDGSENSLPHSWHVGNASMEVRGRS